MVYGCYGFCIKCNAKYIEISTRAEISSYELQYIETTRQSSKPYSIQHWIESLTRGYCACVFSWSPKRFGKKKDKNKIRMPKLFHKPGKCCVAFGILVCRCSRICWLLNILGPYAPCVVGLGGPGKPLSENEFCRTLTAPGEFNERCRCAWNCRAAAATV